MSNWSSQTKRRVVLLAVGTVALLAGIWFLVIVKLQNELKDKADKIQSVKRQIEVTQTGVRLAEKYNNELDRNGLVLTDYETQMAQGDLYLWITKSLRPLQSQFDVTVTDVTFPRVGELNVPPKVPYKAASYTVNGTARFHEFGSFLAELENSSPFIRVKTVILDASASSVSSTNQSDRLGFKLEFSTLVNPKPGKP